MRNISIDVVFSVSDQATDLMQNFFHFLFCCNGQKKSIHYCFIQFFFKFLKSKENDDLQQVVTDNDNIPQTCRDFIYFSRQKSCGWTIIFSECQDCLFSYALQYKSADNYQDILIKLNVLSFIQKTCLSDEKWVDIYILFLAPSSACSPALRASLFSSYSWWIYAWKYYQKCGT